MKFLFFVLALALAESIVFQNCEPNPIFITNSIDMTPVSPKLGDVVKIVINGNSTERCEAGTMDTTISLRNVPVFEYHYDLCKISVQPCPIEKGDWTGVLTQNTPKFAFIGSYTSRSVAKDDKGRVLSCVMFNFTIVR